MRITENSWVMEYADYRMDDGTYGPATAYYRKTDIDKAMRYHGDQAGLLPTTRPTDPWNDYSDLGAMVADQVRPYRITRH